VDRELAPRRPAGARAHRLRHSRSHRQAAWSVPHSGQRGSPASGYRQRTQSPADRRRRRTNARTAPGPGSRDAATPASSVTIDWQVRENARAQIRALVKRVLRKHGYPMSPAASSGQPIQRGGRTSSITSTNLVDSCVCPAETMAAGGMA